MKPSRPFTTEPLPLLQFIDTHALQCLFGNEWEFLSLVYFLIHHLFITCQLFGILWEKTIFISLLAQQGLTTGRTITCCLIICLFMENWIKERDIKIKANIYGLLSARYLLFMLCFAYHFIFSISYEIDSLIILFFLQKEACSLRKMCFPESLNSPPSPLTPRVEFSLPWASDEFPEMLSYLKIWLNWKWSYQPCFWAMGQTQAAGAYLFPFKDLWWETIKIWMLTIGRQTNATFKRKKYNIYNILYKTKHLELLNPISIITSTFFKKANIYLIDK